MTTRWIGWSNPPQPTPTPNPVPFYFRYIASGGYTMGSPPDEPGRDDDEGPRHEVILTRAFYISETEVYRWMWNEIGGFYPTLPDDPSIKQYSPTLDHPVQNVTWYESVLFCNLMSRYLNYERCYYTDAEFTNPIDASNYIAGPFYCNFDANGIRLPTESEWEYACRAGTTTAFFCDETNYSTENCGSCTPGMQPLLEQYCLYCANDSGICCYAYCKLPNPWGLADMHGNVWEWCWDWFGTYPSGRVTDPKGSSSGSFRVERGGSWSSSARLCRSAARVHDDPGSRSPSLGFRIARTAS